MGRGGVGRRRALDKDRLFITLYCRELDMITIYLSSKAVVSNINLDFSSETLKINPNLVGNKFLVTNCGFGKYIKGLPKLIYQGDAVF